MKKVILSFAFALVAMAGYSQSDEFTHTVTLTLTDVFEIEKTTASTDDLTFTFSDGDDYENGVENTSAAELQVRSNKDWQVNVKADAANFTPAGSGSTSMPASVIEVKESSATSYLTLSTTDQQLTTGSAGGYSAANTFSVDYNADPGFSYAADTYTMDVVYTVSAQ